jgi:dUTP pyrophosphatase
MSLYIYASNPELRDMLARFREKYRPTDSGFDIPMIGETINMFYDTHRFNLGIKVAAMSDQMENMPCLLLARSSLAKSPFRLSNSIGLIDMGYRGSVLAAVDIYAKDTATEVIEPGTRLFQICRNDFRPWQSIYIVNQESDLPIAPDNRGAGGFGST